MGGKGAGNGGGGWGGIANGEKLGGTLSSVA
jgi:hypothetical protein